MATTAGAKKGLWSTIRRIAASDRISGLIMLGFALTGLVLANLPATAHAFETVAETHLFIPYTNLDLPIGHWAQDGLLTIFFLTVGLELKQELTTGSLANPKAAAVPMLCAVGGMIAPPILFLAVTALFSQIGPGEPGTLILTTTGSSIPFSEMSHGWAVPTATDIAFSLAVLALFAKALPGSIRAFLMTLATVDDLLAIILIAVFFSSINALYWFIGIAVCAAIWAYLVRLKKVPWIAVGIVGILAWIMMFEAGVLPTLAGVLVGLLTPSREMHGELSPRRTLCQQAPAILRTAGPAHLRLVRHRRTLRVDEPAIVGLAAGHRTDCGFGGRQTSGYHHHRMAVHACGRAQDGQGAACARHDSRCRRLRHWLHCVLPHRFAGVQERGTFR